MQRSLVSPQAREFVYQTIVDNVSLVDEELLHQINLLVVEQGHNLLKKKKSRLRRDSLKRTAMFWRPMRISLLI